MEGSIFVADDGTSTPAVGHFQTPHGWHVAPGVAQTHTPLTPSVDAGGSQAVDHNDNM